MQDDACPPKLVRIKSPARLHLGFLDIKGHAGRQFGSIGLAIDAFCVHIEASSATKTSITTKQPQKINAIKAILSQFYATLGKTILPNEQGVKLNLIDTIPEHAGLGSGTQLMLTIATALCRLHNIKANTRDIAAQFGRGSRSGIGVATFDHGGFIIDGGTNNNKGVPPVLVRLALSEDWRIVLISDNAQQGIHGEKERMAFSALPAFPLNTSQAICHQVLMKLQPAIIEQNSTAFGEAITAIQVLIGDYFSPMQGGRYTSQKVEAMLNYAKSLGNVGIAQSSWGPTGCVFVGNVKVAEKLVANLRQYSANTFPQSPPTLTIAKANNLGANIATKTS